MKKGWSKTQAQYAQIYGCDERTIRTYQTAGVPLDDEEKARAVIAAQHRGPAGAEPADLADAKLQKLALECRRLRIKADTEEKAVIPFAIVDAWLAQLAAAVESGFDAVIAECPQWTGLSPAKAQERAKAIKKRITAEFHAAPRRLLTA